VTIGPRDLIGPAGIAAAVIFAILLARSCNRADSLEGEIRRERERGSLADAGVPAIDIGGEKDIEKALEEEKKKSALLAATLLEAEAKIKAATGKPPKVVEVIRYSTKPGPAVGAPVSGPVAGGSPTTLPCLVPVGSTLQIDFSGARLETRAGNVVVTGVAACVRITPLPEARIYEGAIDPSSVKGMKLEKSGEKGLAPSRRWIAGVVGSSDGAKWGVGPSLGYAGNRFVFTLGGTFGEDSRVVGAAHVRW
jgi:hypothetical protein